MLMHHLILLGWVDPTPSIITFMEKNKQKHIFYWKLSFSIIFIQPHLENGQIKIFTLNQLYDNFLPKIKENIRLWSTLYQKTLNHHKIQTKYSQFYDYCF